jgi:hypothetical protein
VLTVNTQFEHELTKLIDEEVLRIQVIVGAGKLKDISDYRDFCGQIAGLERAKVYCDEVNTLLAKR